MTIERIDPATIPWVNSGRHRCPEVVAALALAVGEALKMPCRWKHYRRPGTALSAATVCGGANTLRAACTAKNMRLQTTCQNKMLYVICVGKKEVPDATPQD